MEAFNQKSYWNRVIWLKTSTHPIDFKLIPVYLHKKPIVEASGCKHPGSLMKLQVDEKLPINHYKRLVQ